MIKNVVERKAYSAALYRQGKPLLPDKKAEKMSLGQSYSNRQSPSSRHTANTFLFTSGQRQIRA
jgi:hypothetical protein